MHTQSATNDKTCPYNNAKRATIDKTRTTKDARLKIMHTQGPTIYKTLQAINKLFYDHLECLSVIKACRAKLQHVALLEVGGAPASPAWRRRSRRGDALSYDLCVARNLEIHLSLEMCYFAIGHTRTHEEGHYKRLLLFSRL